MSISTTIIIIAATAIVSLIAFSNDELKNKLLLYPALMRNNTSEYHRFITSGFVHSDMVHLFFNMYVLYMFGEAVETMYSIYWGKKVLFFIMYMLALLASSLPSFAKHRENYYYRALGASGAVSAVVFSFIYFQPWAILKIFGIIPIPAIVAGILYLVYSAYAAKKAQDNIGHDAHFYGAVFGFIFTFIFDPTHGKIFFNQIINPTFY
ncbi:MAG: rhomboid family intramembrane serine protease [Chitinophagales bacterium]|nr:rhomboid family intramembrane serine protease [Chitinophagaceae bacterium]MCB9065854.1 rhomboid family intramembrane serine protease [Chitinophagales bacterium]